METNHERGMITGAHAPVIKPYMREDQNRASLLTPRRSISTMQPNTPTMHIRLMVIKQLAAEKDTRL